ncbi:MAG TPA: trypsin-like peptidase domain-containing protein [Pseudonocardia sp.]|nr:trypsin-like peptidase domain-containing protein [Pseudonocardia sp.]
MANDPSGPDAVTGRPDEGDPGPGGQRHRTDGAADATVQLPVPQHLPPPPAGWPGPGPGYGSPPPGWHPNWPPPPGAGFGTQVLPAVRHPDARGRPRRGGLIALGLVAMLLSGVIGGVVGTTLVQGGRSGSIGALGEPLPDIDESATPTTPVEAVAARVLPSVVQLRVEGPATTGEGSAMVLSPDGLLLTNNHVVEAAAQAGTVTAVFHDGTTAPALIVGRDPSSDLAVIRAQNVTGLVPVELGNSDSVRVGQQVVAFGAPLGLGGTVTTGIISAVDRAVNVGEETGANTPTVLNALQTDAAINPGNSGGPLVDMQGRVIGINSAIATTGAQGGSIGVGFSIPVNQARRVAEELERTGRASRAVLGVTVTDNPRQAGAVIREVVPGGAAERAGIRAGDVVLRFGDQRINTGIDLQAAVGSRAPGEVVEVQLGDRTVQATLTAAPN